MMMKNKYRIVYVLILVTVCIISAGCISPQTPTSPQRNLSTITIPPQTLSSTATPKTLVTTQAPINSTMANPVDSKLTATLNSAVKRTVIGELKPKPGNIFLVLNVTIQNKDTNNGFEYRDSSFIIYDKVNEDKETAITSIVANILNLPVLTTGTIPPKSTQTGLIVFGVNESSKSYKFSVVDMRGIVLASIDNIEVP